MSSNSRREFLAQVAGATVFGLAAFNKAVAMPNKTLYEISLAEWSLNRAIKAGKMTNLDFPVMAKQKFGISTVEYVNQFFKDKAKDTTYLDELLKRCRDNGVRNHLIMVDGEGDLGSPDKSKRDEAVENHKKWVDAAKHLDCITIRVNAHGTGTSEEVQKASAEAIGKLAEYAQAVNINVIVENHGGFTSSGEWMAGLMKAIGKKNVGTLPDFNNFCMKRDNGQLWGGNCIEEYDRYKGTAEMMPFAKGVSAKTLDFDAEGNCIETDYPRIFKIIKDSGFKGIVGIEYEGDKLSEEEGIIKTKQLLEKTFMQLS
jgi:sugar phosphate isomerase/epimerase